jgi:hypothetical protein
MTTRIIRLTALLIALLTPLAPARAGWRGGIGVLGDSYSDEYQFYPRTGARPATGSRSSPRLGG